MNDDQRMSGYRGCDSISDALNHTGLEVAYFVCLEDTVVSSLEGYNGVTISKDYITNAVVLPKGLVVPVDQVKASTEGWFSRIQLVSGSIMMYFRPQKGHPNRPNQPNGAI